MPEGILCNKQVVDTKEKLDALLAAGAQEANADKRSEIYGDIQKILADDMPVVNLFEMQFLTVYNEKLKDHATSALGAYGPFDRAWLDD